MSLNYRIILLYRLYVVGQIEIEVSALVSFLFKFSSACSFR